MQRVPSRPDAQYWVDGGVLTISRVTPRIGDGVVALLPPSRVSDASKGGTYDQPTIGRR